MAAIELTTGPPLILLTDHVEGERPILVYRVEDLEATLTRQEDAGWVRERSFEIRMVRAARSAHRAAIASRSTS